MALIFAVFLINPAPICILDEVDAQVFAVKALKAIQQKKSYVVIPWQMGVVGKLMRLLPNWFYDRLAVNGPRKPRRAG